MKGHSQNPTESIIQALKVHLKKYCISNDIKASLSLTTTILIEVIAIFLINCDQHWSSFIGWAIHSLNMVRIFVQFHDMAHLTFFQSTTVNQAIGTIFGIYINFPF